MKRGFVQKRSPCRLLEEPWESSGLEVCCSDVDHEESPGDRPAAGRTLSLSTGNIPSWPRSRSSTRSCSVAPCGSGSSGTAGTTRTLCWVISPGRTLLSGRTRSSGSQQTMRNEVIYLFTITHKQYKHISDLFLKRQGNRFTFNSILLRLLTLVSYEAWMSCKVYLKAQIIFSVYSFQFEPWAFLSTFCFKSTDIFGSFELWKQIYKPGRQICCHFQCKTVLIKQSRRYRVQFYFKKL